MDLPLLLIGASLIAALTAYFMGFIPYPIGWLVLSLLLILRVRYLRRKDDDRRDDFEA